MPDLDRVRRLRARLAGQRDRLAEALAVGRRRLTGVLVRLRAWGRAAAARLARLGLTGARLGALIVLIATVLAGGAYAASTFYAQYGSPKVEVNTAAWADRPVGFSRTACQSCHTKEAAIQTSGLHASVTCEACHGPLGGHPGTTAGVIVALATTPTSTLCVTCHTRLPGRPASLPQVDPTTHFSGGLCLRCHDPHTIVAVKPPEVTHPLADLPPCTTCHNPTGLKKIPAGHELVADSVCLSCHGPRKATP